MLQTTHRLDDRVLRLRGLLASLDRQAFQRLTAIRSPLLDRVLPALSSAADDSLLWIGTAGLLRTVGRQRGRRAALRGLASAGLTSALVNIPLKLFWRRARPEAFDVGSTPVRRPNSFSFPSGHTASAFAFAIGAGGEVPLLLLPLIVLAGGVGWSRVHARVHYPSDVLVGAAIGTVVGLASRPLAALLGKEAQN